MRREDAVAAELAHIPDVSEWPGLTVQERERRALVLAEIRRRVAENGPHRAQPGADRGRLFMPFAALKGFGELVSEAEREG